MALLRRNIFRNSVQWEKKLIFKLCTKKCLATNKTQRKRWIRYCFLYFYIFKVSGLWHMVTCTSLKFLLCLSSLSTVKVTKNSYKTNIFCTFTKKCLLAHFCNCNLGLGDSGGAWRAPVARLLSQLIGNTQKLQKNVCIHFYNVFTYFMLFLYVFIYKIKIVVKVLSELDDPDSQEYCTTWPNDFVETWGSSRRADLNELMNVKLTNYKNQNINFLHEYSCFVPFVIKMFAIITGKRDMCFCE